MGWRAGRLCTALEVFASVWFGVPAVRLVVAQCSPAASLTDDLQLARLARAAAVAAWAEAARGKIWFADSSGVLASIPYTFWG